jgi:YceI-like protein
MSTTSTAVQAPPVGRYVVDPAGSSVTFVTKHMFGLGKVRGTFKVTRGVITIADPPQDSRVEAEVSASSFSTGNFLHFTSASAEGAAIVLRADCTVDRYAHAITMMPGMAARRLSVQITARATSA